jgi:hypothetical protein
VFKAWLRMTFRPFSSLSLEPEPTQLATFQPSPAATDLVTGARHRQMALQIYGAAMAIVFVALIVVLKLTS